MSGVENPLRGLPEAAMPLSDIADPEPGTAEFEASEIRGRATHDITVMPWLPQLPDAWMDEVYERIERAEREFAAPNRLSAEYGPGTATVDNEVGEVHGPGNYLFSAVHATETIRRATGKLGFAEPGTAGVTAVLAEDYGHGFIMRGRQTGNAAVNETHPMKDHVLPYVPEADGFLDIHGSASHLFVRPDDRFNIHAHVGLGADPSEALREFASSVVRYGREELGLYVVIGNDQRYYSQKEPGALKHNEDGTPYTGQLGGTKPNMMNNFVRREMAAAGVVAPSLQVELPGFNRLVAADVSKKDQQTEVISVALGYKLLEHIVERSLAEQLETL